MSTFRPTRYAIRQKNSSKYLMVQVSDILYCVANGDGCIIYFTDGGKAISSKSLLTIQTELPASKFVRIHQSHLVNLQHVAVHKNKDVNIVIMSNGEELPISRRYKMQLYERVSLL